ncbi:hypothetical protein QBC47DRAFT_410524 [Echria macrotheca]|uniref:Uncharacterized protein n=1 Tax=Echria macrotheca TaxID=438768 RepID=A0AAJ0BK76_9PEZI|nr:hypothetical protein QBC47DRAFT_410524 [Echria macrotheca]
MSSTCDYNCSLSSRERELTSYADVAGPGVIAGFLGTAWLCVILVVAHYLLVFDPAEDPFHDEDHPRDAVVGHPWVSNPIDVVVTAYLERMGNFISAVRHKPRTGRMRRNPNWQGAFVKAVLAMCDVQIVTGLGILISGFADLRCGISAYHFLLVGLIAWFSNLTHIAGLTVLRQYLHRRPVEKWARLFFMFTLSVMLLVAMGPTIFFNWAAPDEWSAALPGSYAICFFNPTNTMQWDDAAMDTAIGNTSAFQSTLMSILLLAFSLGSRTIKLQSSLSGAVTKMRSRLSNFYTTRVYRVYGIGTATSGRARFTKKGKRMRVALAIHVSTLLLFRIYTDLLTSTLSDIYWLLVSAIWGTIKLFSAKQSADVEENSWAFGQILPAFLLLSPLLSISEIFSEPRREPVDAPPPETENVPPADDSQSSSQPQDNSATAAIGTTTMSEFDLAGDLDEGGVHPADTVEMHRYIKKHLTRNYYDIKTCRWISFTLFLVCLQVASITGAFLVNSAIFTTSAVMFLGQYATMIFFTSPTIMFLAIFFYYLSENANTGKWAWAFSQPALFIIICFQFHCWWEAIRFGE